MAFISFSEKMCNVNAIYFENFEYGCHMSVLIAEYETGPYIEGNLNYN